MILKKSDTEGVRKTALSLTGYLYELLHSNKLYFRAVLNQKMHQKMLSQYKSPWVLSEAPNSWSAIYFQFSVQPLQRMSPVVITHLRFGAGSLVRQASLYCSGHLPRMRAWLFKTEHRITRHLFTPLNLTDLQVSPSSQFLFFF